MTQAQSLVQPHPPSAPSEEEAEQMTQLSSVRPAAASEAQATPRWSADPPLRPGLSHFPILFCPLPIRPLPPDIAGDGL